MQAHLFIDAAAFIYSWPHRFIDADESIYTWSHLYIDAAHLFIDGSASTSTTSTSTTTTSTRTSTTSTSTTSTGTTSTSTTSTSTTIEHPQLLNARQGVEHAKNKKKHTIDAKGAVASYKTPPVNKCTVRVG